MLSLRRRSKSTPRERSPDRIVEGPPVDLEPLIDPDYLNRMEDNILSGGGEDLPPRESKSERKQRYEERMERKKAQEDVERIMSFADDLRQLIGDQVTTKIDKVQEELDEKECKIQEMERKMAEQSQIVTRLLKRENESTRFEKDMQKIRNTTVDMLEDSAEKIERLERENQEKGERRGIWLKKDMEEIRSINKELDESLGKIESLERENRMLRTERGEKVSIFPENMEASFMSSTMNAMQGEKDREKEKSSLCEKSAHYASVLGQDFFAVLKHELSETFRIKKDVVEIDELIIPSIPETPFRQKESNDPTLAIKNLRSATFGFTYVNGQDILGFLNDYSSKLEPIASSVTSKQASQFLQSLMGSHGRVADEEVKEGDLKKVYRKIVECYGVGMTRNRIEESLINLAPSSAFANFSLYASEIRRLGNLATSNISSPHEKKKRYNNLCNSALFKVVPSNIITALNRAGEYDEQHLQDVSSSRVLQMLSPNRAEIEEHYYKLIGKKPQKVYQVQVQGAGADPEQAAGQNQQPPDNRKVGGAGNKGPCSFCGRPSHDETTCLFKGLETLNMLIEKLTSRQGNNGHVSNGVYVQNKNQGKHCLLCGLTNHNSNECRIYNGATNLPVQSACSLCLNKRNVRLFHAEAICQNKGQTKPQVVTPANNQPPSNQVQVQAQVHVPPKSGN